MRTRLLQTRPLRSLGALLLLMLLAGPERAMAQEKTAPPSRGAAQYSFARIIQRVRPAVVYVSTQKRVPGVRTPFDHIPEFREFFRQFGDPFGVPRDRVQTSLGSGVIVRADGMVITNYHVVSGRRNEPIRVTLHDHSEYEARIVMADPGTDLAVLKIIGGGRFEPIEMADSDRVEVGDLVLAVGNPFGVGQTVTMGIISGPLRGRIGKAKHQVFLQTDAAINPGNSGGPLISMSGRLIGINTIILSKSGGSHGIGFAIPSNLAQLVLDSALRGDSRVVWPWIGADLHPVRRDLAQGLGLRRIAGAFVNSVSRNGPAQRAGLMPQDVIVKVDGIDIDDPRLVLYRLALRGIGKRSTLEVIRRGRPVSVTMDITAPPKQSADDVLVLDGNHPLQGATVANISPDMAEERGIAEGIGVLVTAVARNSRVADSLRVDDVIVELLGQRITSVEQIRGLVDTPDRVWPIVVIRDGRRIRGVVR